MDSLSSFSSHQEFDYLFKLLMIGDSSIGKNNLLSSFTFDNFEDLSPTIGVEFKVKYVDVREKKLKLAIWDTGGKREETDVDDAETTLREAEKEIEPFSYDKNH